MKQHIYANNFEKLSNKETFFTLKIIYIFLNEQNRHIVTKIDIFFQLFSIC